MRKSIAVMEGDGGAEIVGAAVQVLEAIGDFEFRPALIGGAALDAWEEAGPHEEGESGDPLPLISRRIARGSNAVLLGPVGGEQWKSDDPRDPVPETAVRTLQKTLNVDAYIQPVTTAGRIAEISPLRPDLAEGVNLVIVRALGGIDRGRGGRNGELMHDEIAYSREEIRAIGRRAFNAAVTLSHEIDERPVVTSVDKSNVMETSRVWRETMEELQLEEYPGVGVQHMLADNAQMQVAGNPRELDVVVVDSFFGGMLAGAASGVSNPGLIPSAWLDKHGRGIYTPARPEGMNNPIPMILSAAMALEYSLDMPEQAKRVKDAVAETIDDGILPGDLGGDATNGEITDAVVQKLSAVTV